jgi:hypothetical protein
MTVSHTLNSRKSFSSIEPLEARIAPAGLHNLAVATNGKSATYTDGDGDLVTVKVTTGALVAGIFTFAAGPVGSDLAILDLSATQFKDANVTITAKPTKTAGDGQAHLGFLNSTNHDLGAVTIGGDLSGLIVGDTLGVDIKSLTVNTIGVANVAGALVAGVPELRVVGTLGKITVKGDFVAARLVLMNVGSISIGGSLVGGSEYKAGHINVIGGCGSLKIAGNVVGGSGTFSGYCVIAGVLGPVTIGGSIIGGTGDNSGLVISPSGNAAGDVKIGGSLYGGLGEYSGSYVGPFKTAKIAGSLFGGAGQMSGVVYPTFLASISIGRDIIGGAGAYSGAIVANSPILAGTVAGSVIGGVGAFSGSILVSVLDTGASGPITIGGDLRGGSGVTGLIWSQTGSLGAVTVKGSAIANEAAFSGGILALGNIGALKIGGDIRGTTANNFFIRAVGTITSIEVGGNVTSTQILAGFGLNNLPSLGNAQIGNVTVGRDWVASSISAGITAGGDGKFGTADDYRSDPNFSSKIASITVKGAVYGTRGGVDNYGFVAHEIGAMKIGAAKVALAATTDVFNVATVTGDVFVREI